MHAENSFKNDMHKRQPAKAQIINPPEITARRRTLKRIIREHVAICSIQRGRQTWGLYNAYIMQGSWNEIISLSAFVPAEYGFQAYYAAEDYAIYSNL